MVNVDKYTSPMEPVAYRIPLYIYISIFHHQFGLPPNFMMPSFSKTRMDSALPHFTALWRAVSPPQPTSGNTSNASCQLRETLRSKLLFLGIQVQHWKQHWKSSSQLGWNPSYVLVCCLKINTSDTIKQKYK